MMKQLLQNLRTGNTELVEIPYPHCKPGCLLIRSINSLISAGTERMLIEFSKSSLLSKAKSQPEKVKQVINKIKTDGLFNTINTVRSQLDQSIPLGYCNAGVILEVGEGVEGFEVGDRVISNGAHAEIICVPKNLCAKVPENVSNEEAAFTVLSSIALQGVRLMQPTMGERIVVIGLGLIGLITVQLLKANGCEVLGIDFDSAKCELAKQFGAKIVNLSREEDPIKSAEQFSVMQGVDGVLITAATKSNEPMHQAAMMCRKRGRIILVGVTGLELSREDFYKKELSFQVSCSYGPGRYDEDYEKNGHDYPIGFVRWTEQRNFETVLQLMADKKINVLPLISHRFNFDEALKAYELLVSKEPSLGILLQYTNDQIAISKRIVSVFDTRQTDPSKPVVGIIGAGNYASRVLIPAFAKIKVNFKTVASNGGITAVKVAKKFHFQQATTDTQTILNDSSINTVVITTQHDSHAKFVVQGLQAGKHIFVEKPLCLTLNELTDIETVLHQNQHQLLMVGFNRRFSPLTQKMKILLDTVCEPKSFIYTVNAGEIPIDHWTQNLAIGGGRIVGEACHFIDLLRYLAGAPIISYQVSQMGKGVVPRDDKVTITLNFEDGSIGSIHYFANGDKSFPKERLEVFCGGKILQLDNFKKLFGFGFKKFKKLSLRAQDKGQENCVKAFVEAITNGTQVPIPLEQIFEIAKITIDISSHLIHR